jgi:hypothetical protein
MKIIALLFTFLFLYACKPKVLSGKELESKLIETMNNYLDTTLKPGVHATVKDVVYFTEAEKKLYHCRFHVNMTYEKRDTTGIVAATISNDFKTISRTQ